MPRKAPQNDFPTDQQHASTLAMLEEVRDYLLKLPPHSQTAEMIGKVNSHLAQPTARLLSNSEQVGKSTLLAINGVPLAEALQRGNTVAVRIPYLNQAEAMPKDFLRQVRTGFLLGFSPAGRSREPLTRESFSDWMTTTHRPLGASSDEGGRVSPPNPFDDLD